MKNDTMKWLGLGMAVYAVHRWNAGLGAKTGGVLRKPLDKIITAELDSLSDVAKEKGVLAMGEKIVIDTVRRSKASPAELAREGFAAHRRFRKEDMEVSPLAKFVMPL